MFKAALFVLLLSFSFFLSGCTLPQQVKNHSVPEPYAWDFGQVNEGEILKHKFILKNDSNKPINIREVDTSCGCTISQVKDKTLLAGKETSLEVQFNTQGYSGPTQQYVYVHTDNLDNPILKFIIKAEVIKSK